MMQVDVYQLPGAPLAVNSFSKRAEQPYLEAFEELRAAVTMAVAESGQAPEVPYVRASVTIVCYSRPGRRGVGRYRPGRVHTLWYVLDPIYRALIDSGVVRDTAAIYSLRVALVRKSEHEGFRIRVQELVTEVVA